MERGVAAARGGTCCRPLGLSCRECWSLIKIIERASSWRALRDVTSVRFGRRLARMAVLAALGAPTLTVRAFAAEAASAAPASSVVGVRIEAPGGAAVDEGALRAAVAAELGMIAAPAGAAAATVVLVRLAPRGELTVTYRAPSGGELSRTVAAPGRTDELPEVTALLVGNLARDEARGLLGDLERNANAPGLDPAAPAAQLDPIRDREASVVDTFNVSVFHPVTLLRGTEHRRLAFELGMFYSRVGALSGVAFTFGGVSRVDGQASGLQLAGIGYIHGGPGEGARIAGIFGVGSDRFDGVSIATAGLVQDGELSGVALAAGAVVATASVDGGQLSAGFNYAGPVSGFQLSAGANVASGDMNGLQAAAGANVATGNVAGAQLAAATNIAAGDVDGVQLTSGFNLASDLSGAQIGIVNVGGDVDGLQLGIVNVGRDVNGAQLGIVNVAREVDGLSLGLVPYSQRGRTQLISWFNTSKSINFGVRFRSGVLYAMPTFGYDPAGTSFQLAKGKASYAAGFSLGVRVPIERASIDVDSNCSNGSNGAAYDEHDINLRHRLLLGWQFSPIFGVFAGGGVHHHFRTQGEVNHQVDPELSVGVELL